MPEVIVRFEMEPARLVGELDGWIVEGALEVAQPDVRARELGVHEGEGALGPQLQVAFEIDVAHQV